MSPISELYNALPDIEDANAAFVDRENVFTRLAPLLAKYDLKYGVTLVHSHCKISDDEIMICDENDVTAPQPSIDGVSVYPDRWLATGLGFEFTMKHIPPPPLELLSQFREIVGGLPLGLYYTGDLDFDGTVGVERTEGRRNIVTRIDADQFTAMDSMPIETGWVPGISGPRPLMVCERYCPTDPKTRRHGGYVHKKVPY